MHATKETMYHQLCSHRDISHCYPDPGKAEWAKRCKRGKIFLFGICWLAVLVGGLVSITFYSSFFTYPQGIIDSITAYQVYFTRAGMDDAHLHPWYYYLDLLVHTKNPSGIPWSELWLLLMALAGFFLLALKKDKKQGDYFMLFIGLYTYLLMIVYSIISYKTPWNILQFYYGTLLLAGYGIVHMFRIQDVPLAERQVLQYWFLRVQFTGYIPVTASTSDNIPILQIPMCMHIPERM